MKGRTGWLLAIAIAALPTGAMAQHGSNPWRDSLKVAAEALAKRPGDIDLRLRKASWNVLLEQWADAQSEYDRILSREPDNVAALFYRAYTNEKLHRNAFARLDYEHLLTIVPTHFESRLGLALLNQTDKHYTEAMDQINILVQQHPDSAIAYAARAGMERERDMLPLAEYDYAEAVRLAPANTDYLLNLADVYIEERKLADARRALLQLEKMGIAHKALEPFYERLK